MDYMTANSAGATVLITGATQGLGYHLAAALARRGATLLLHGRDPARLDATAKEIRDVAPACTVRTYTADLADLDQVRDLAARVRSAEPRIDALVNNAAVGGGTDPARREVSPQGHELRLAVNHLAPVTLTRGLLAPLRSSALARVVNVASLGQETIDLDDVQLRHRYEGVHAYCRSKLALIMGTFDLAEELRGSGVTANALHPAHLMPTQMVRQSGFTPETRLADGVAPTLRLVRDPALAETTGRYFDRFVDQPAHHQAYDPEARRRLAEITTALTSD
ncbi:SDR family NAD(P)-dependent oxidoreductase [Halostreptopolyspora alba]|uniref:SDR family NAD(P)-dependent oxidoreductase n=2 Tax=Halostreptopolyspora alba TaxID=2487137 RepID=A0A3N0E405_9ACTN|nr:SDR family NAD(P)-dependent oxidoreductase [Nocardiopsaceae bacterium YIM 96095]